jgi:hypothetical protein
LLVVLALRQVASLDVGFHLTAGRYILAGNGWPRTDPFTYTVNDHAYVDTSWGYQVLLSLVERAAGAPGLVLLHVGLWLVTFGLVLWTVRLGPHLRAVLPALLLLGVLASELRFETRPEVLSYALLALVLYVLHRHRERAGAPLWPLPAIFLVWANCHSLFVLGWAALLAFVVGDGFERGRLDRRLAAWSALACGVTVCNPYGWRAWTFPLTLATRFSETNVFNRTIAEFRSPLAVGAEPGTPFYPWLPVLSWGALAVLALAALPLCWRRRRFACGLVALAFVALSAQMVRNMPLLAVAGIVPIARVLGVGTAQVRRRTERRRGRFEAALALAVTIVAVTVGLRVHHDAYYIATRRQDRFGLGWNASVLPVGAAAYASREQLPGRMLNHLNFGGYLMWALPEPVFIDGRLEVMGEAFFEEYRRALGEEAALEAAVARHGVSWIVFPYRTNPRLLARLSRDPRWLLGYVDRLSAVFLRAGPGARERIDASAQAAARGPAGALDVAALAGLGGGARPHPARRWLSGLVRQERFPSEPFEIGLFHYFRGEFSQAAARFAAGIADSDGAYYELYQNLGSALFRSDRRSEARACYRIVLDEVPGDALARERIREIDGGKPVR